MARWIAIVCLLPLSLGCSSDDESSSGDSTGSGGAGAAAGSGGSSAGGSGGTGTDGSGGAGGGSSGGSAGAGGSAGSPSSGGSAGSGGNGTGGSGTGGSSGGGSGGVGGGPGPDPASLGCPALPASSGPSITVAPSQAGQLHQIVLDADPGTTILLEDGTYDISSIIQIAKDGLTLRSVSDDASSVIIDATYTVNEAIAISASDVTVAHVTITRAVDHPIHAYTTSSADITGTLLYGLRLIDGGEQFVKVNPGTSGGYVDQGTIECSYFELTDAGRPNIESCCGGCYTGGIDVHAGWGWVVRNNYFQDIYCTNGGLAEHAVHFWNGARDTLVENNTIVDCARGVGFGLGGGVGDRDYPDDPNGGTKLAHYDGIIRNNVIYADHGYYDTGIEVQIASRPVVVHNTVVSTDNATGFFSSIDYRFAETDVYIANNLTRRITVRDGASGTVENNLESTPFSHFVDPSGVDFHLVSGATSAIDQGIAVSEAGTDIDGETHDNGAPDLGADEYNP